MEKYIIALAIGGTILFAGCGGPSEDPDALGKGEPASTISDMSDKDKKALEKMGIKFDPNPDESK
jgi:hypothetical protein|tara:strand:+ start:648 stop:842 length:195 start_codon:yes stop_codon:yes gene_type:complete